MTPGVNLTQNFDQLEMSQILLLLYTKFHKIWMKFEKDKDFDITPFENS